MNQLIAFEAVLFLALETLVVGDVGSPFEQIFAAGRRAPLVLIWILDNQQV